MNGLRHLRNRLVAIVAALSLATAGLAAAGQPAHAASGDLTCGLLVLHINLTPPLSLVNMTTAANGGGPLNVCASRNGAHSTLTDAAVAVIGTATFAWPMSASVKGTATFKWNTGEVSTLTFGVYSQPLSQKFEAKITDGRLKGDTCQGLGTFLPQIDPWTGSLTGLTITATAVSFG